MVRRERFVSSCNKESHGSGVVIWIRGEGAVIVVVVCTYVLCVAVLGQGISLASFTPSARNSVCGRATQRPGGEN